MSVRGGCGVNAESSYGPCARRNEYALEEVATCELNYEKPSTDRLGTQILCHAPVDSKFAPTPALGRNCFTRSVNSFICRAAHWKPQAVDQ